MPRPWPRGVSYLAAAAFAGLATAAGILGRAHLAAPDLVMLYLLAIGAAAALLGRGAALLTSALSVGCYDYFFVEPFHTFSVQNERHLLTFAMMFIVGLAISGLTERARRAGEQARTEEMRSSLLSAVSHDLRTPLAAITGAATTLRQGGAEVAVEQRSELLDAICVEAERLERLLANLLDMTQLDSGARQVLREWVPLEEVVGSALSRLETQLDSRPIRIDLPADLPLVSADPVLLELVLVNLLENAAKYTPPATALDVVARRSGATLTVEIADRGPGLPPGSERRIFEKFVRGRHPGVAGAGLGLAICNAIVVAHGGALSGENRPGGGAAFRFTLPAPAGAPVVPPEPHEAPGPKDER